MHGIAGRLMRWVSALLRVAGAALVLFHVWLFLSMAAQGRLSDPAVTFRWLVALGLALGLLALRRAGIPLVLSRQGAALWVLVVVLHASAFSGPAVPLTEPVADVAALFVLPATSAVVTVVAAWLLVRTRARCAAASSFVPRPLWWLRAFDVAPGSPLVVSPLAPRAPPTLHVSSL